MAGGTVPGMFHPWRTLRALGDGTFMSVEPTPGDKPAWWSPASDTFLIRPGQSQVERRCALTHELGHRTLKHSGVCRYPDSPRQNRKQEQAADMWAVQKLITLPQLASALKWTRDRDELAEELWVIRRYVDLRLDHLMGGEQLRLRALLATSRDRDEDDNDDPQQAG